MSQQRDARYLDALALFLIVLGVFVAAIGGILLFVRDLESYVGAWIWLGVGITMMLPGIVLHRKAVLLRKHGA